MNNQVLFGSALVALGVATGSLLAPQAASALDFNFSFGGVTGLITGLAEGSNPCGLNSGCLVSVLDAGISGAPTGLYPAFTGPSGVGFSVTGGTVVSSDWIGIQAESDRPVPLFSLLGLVGGEGSLSRVGERESGPLTFTSASAPPSAVPGPLPVLGAAAAFGYTRKLRKRIKGSTPIA